MFLKLPGTKNQKSFKIKFITLNTSSMAFPCTFQFVDIFKKNIQTWATLQKYL